MSTGKLVKTEHEAEKHIMEPRTCRINKNKAAAASISSHISRYVCRRPAQGLCSSTHAHQNSAAFASHIYSCAPPRACFHIFWIAFQANGDSGRQLSLLPARFSTSRLAEPPRRLKDKHKWNGKYYKLARKHSEHCNIVPLFDLHFHCISCAALLVEEELFSLFVSL
jgi:hypothetical protein